MAQAPTPIERLARIAGALPDAATAGFFAVLWIAPQCLWPQALRTGLLMMLVEFILVHATGMLGGMALARKAGDGSPWKLLLGFTGFYLLFVGAFAWQFQAWWPLLALAWLLAGKVALLLQPIADERKKLRLQADWALGVLAYLVGAFATTFLPVPRLGLERAVVSAAELPGSGHWVSQPQSVVAFGLFYFSVLALSKAFDWRLPTTPAAPAGQA